MKILLATDGQPASDGAIRMAEVLARQESAEVRLVRVVEPMPVLGEGSALASIPMAGEDEEFARGAVALTELGESLQRFGPPASDWPRTVEVGSIPHAIVQTAEDMGATHILLGIGRHALIDRWLGTETALRVMQLAHMPVIAVPERGGYRPRRIVAAVDFSRFSTMAIERALEIAQPNSDIHLIHVAWISPGENRSFEYAEWHERLQHKLREELEVWSAGIPELVGHRVTLHVPAGKAAEEILSLADDIDADMIAAGSHGHGFFGRAVFGSVSKVLMRRAKCAVMVAPPPEPAHDLRWNAVQAEVSNRS